MEKEKSCGAVVVRRIGNGFEYLVVKSKAHNHWGFPKGHIDLGETEEETTLREVSEETGLSVKLLKGFREIVSYSPKIGINKDVVYFIGLADKKEVKIQDEEIKEYMWQSLDTVYNLLTFDNDKNIIKRPMNF
jgi:tRNA nucleotidyltransferase (CCA-adding enzyme)